MTLTSSQITAGATYSVRLDGTLSGKRFRDAAALAKSIGTRPETSSVFDAASKTWTVTLPADSVGGLADLRTLAGAYDSAVEIAGTASPAPAVTARTAGRSSETQRASRLYGMDMAEYGTGFTPDEM